MFGIGCALFDQKDDKAGDEEREAERCPGRDVKSGGVLELQVVELVLSEAWQRVIDHGQTMIARVGEIFEQRVRNEIEC